MLLEVFKSVLQQWWYNVLKIWFITNLNQSLGRFSRQQNDDILLIFSENRVWQFMQIVSLVDNLHEMSNPNFWKSKNKILLKFSQHAKH